jgi:ElaB/YqjD/DUF883 family membrane-anchored ribosome-binding protein
LLTQDQEETMTTATETAPQTAAAAPCGWPALDSVERTVREVREIVTDARHATDALAKGAADQVRERPLASVGVAAVAGLVAGAVFGLGYAWLAQRRPPA